MVDQFTGKMFMYAVGSAVVAFPVALALLLVFRRSVVAGMSRSGVASEQAPIAGASAPERTPGRAPTLRDADRSLCGAMAVHSLGAIAATATLTLALLWQLESFKIGAFALFFIQHAWPLLFIGWMVPPRGPIRAAYYLAGAFVTLALFGITLALSDLALWDLIKAVLFPGWVATGLIVPFMTRRIRASGPLVLLIVTATVLGWNLILDVAESSSAFMASLLGAQDLVGGFIVLGLVFVVGSAAGLVVVWPALRGIGLLYDRKLFSDQSLTLDVVMVWFCALLAIPLAVEARQWIFAGAVAFLVYKAHCLAGFGALALLTPERARADMLLLRPFSLGRRSERLFEHLSRVWLRIGAIHMIAGPDLVLSTVKPPEFLTFLSGRLSRRFVSDGEGLRQHLAGLDVMPDPDGRHRVNQLFCHDDMWRQAMQELAALSRAILMDLRGLTPANQGCAYEIGELIRNVPLGRVVFAVDGTTDRAFLDYTVEQIRQSLPSDSPNRSLVSLAPYVVFVDESTRGRTLLLQALLERVKADQEGVAWTSTST